MKATQKQNCTTCHFYFAWNTKIGGYQGQCNRYPPTPVVIDGDRIIPAAIPVSLSMICGEYEDIIREEVEYDYSMNMEVWSDDESLESVVGMTPEKRDFLDKFLGRCKGM